MAKANVDANSDWQSGKKLTKSLLLMYENEILTDVTFSFPSKVKLKAHKLILMAKSHVFYTMFNSDLHKPGEEITIEDVEPDNFREFLRFLYTDEVTLNAGNAPQVIYCAEKYSVSVLKSTGLAFLKNNMDKTNVALTLEQAVLYNDASLIQACIEFFSKHKNLKFLNKHHVSKKTLEVIIDCEDLAVKIADIIKAVDAWAEEECKVKNLLRTPVEKREVLGSVRDKIPFCSMTPEEFRDVSCKDLITETEELQVYKFISSSSKDDKPPFPCRPQVATEAFVPFPRLVASSKDGSFCFSIKCNVEFTLKGLVFAEAGSYSIFVKSQGEEFKVNGPNSRVTLRKPCFCQFQESLFIGDKPYNISKRRGDWFIKLDETSYRNVEFEMAQYKTEGGHYASPINGLIVEF